MPSKALRKWKTEDRKAKSNIILSIAVSDLKQVKRYFRRRGKFDQNYRNDIVYQLGKPASKESHPFKTSNIIYIYTFIQKMYKYEHLHKIFNKLSLMKIEIDLDLLTVSCIVYVTSIRHVRYVT